MAASDQTSLPDSHKGEVDQLYKEWEEAAATEDDATSRVESTAAALEAYGIDPNDPPAWLTGEPADEDWGKTH